MDLSFCLKTTEQRKTMAKEAIRNMRGMLRVKSEESFFLWSLHSLETQIKVCLFSIALAKVISLWARRMYWLLTITLDREAVMKYDLKGN